MTTPALSNYFESYSCLASHILTLSYTALYNQVVLYLASFVSRIGEKKADSMSEYGTELLRRQLNGEFGVLKPYIRVRKP